MPGIALTDGLLGLGKHPDGDCELSGREWGWRQHCVWEQLGVV